MRSGDDDLRVQADTILDDYIDECELAAQLGISLRTCQRFRQLRSGPPYITVGRHVFYRPAAVREWLQKQEQSSEQKLTRSRARTGR